MMETREKIVSMLADLAKILDQIDDQLKRIERVAHNTGIPVNELQTKDGRYLWYDAWVNKANVYGSIATLQDLLDRIDRAEGGMPPRE